jgi:hypothetical protein
VFNVDVPRFLAFSTEEEKPKTSLTPYFRHAPTVALDQRGSSSLVRRTGASVSAERKRSGAAGPGQPIETAALSSRRLHRFVMCGLQCKTNTGVFVADPSRGFT